MLPRQLTALLALTTVVVPTAIAQPPTFVVDAANGPGANFTDIGAAVAAVPDGSVLLVRAGAYGPVDILGKGVTILCDAGVTAQAGTFSGFLRIQATAAHQRVVVRGLRPAAFGNGILIANAAGPVLVDGQGAAIVPGPFVLDASCYVDASDAVVLRALDLRWRTAISNSVVILERCVLQGQAVAVTTVEPDALTATGSTVQLVHSSVSGGLSQSLVTTQGGAAARLLNSSLRIVGTAAHSLRGGATLFNPAPTTPLRGTGIVRVDPAVALLGVPVAEPGIALSVAEQPGVIADDAVPGGIATAWRFGGANLWLMLLGEPTVPLLLPGFADAIWFDPAAWQIVGSGAGPSPTGTPVSLQVPALPSLVGAAGIWQTMELDPALSLVVSSASPAVVR